MYAVIKTGGKQYRVAANDKILIEKLEGEAGDQVEFGEVLLVANGGTIDVGAPHVAGATVVGEIAAQEKSETVYIFKKRRRKHYRRRNGHRQLLTSVTIIDILTGGAKPTAKAKAAKPAKTDGEAGATSKTKSTKADAGKSGADTSATNDKAAKKSKSEPATLASAGAVSGKVDDISLIGGIGPKMHQTLTEMGITTFAQIASWTAADIEKYDEVFKPKGRIAREEWVEQAKELMAGKAPRAKSDRERE